ncbi:MAG: hypothetical protein M1834_005448 [Cirrosporium novae-zelandiae]|nr:MAG: hypothetical protein M1834_005448 [Cirrosporium novae-zelandiae]
MMQSDRAGSLNQEGRKPPARTPSNDPPSKISKRKRTNPQASPSANPTEFPKKFEFIVGNDDKARKNARVHVMKEFMRKKRFEETGHADEEPSSSSHKKKGRRRRSDKRPSSEPLQTLSPTSDHALPSASTPLGNVGTVGNVVHNVDPNQAYVAGPSTSLPYRPELGPLSIPQTSPSYAASIPTPYASTALTTPMGHNFIPEPTYTYDASLPNTTATSYYAADLYQQNPLVDSLDAWSAAVQWRSTPDPGLRLEAYGAKRLVYERRPEGEEDNAQWEEVQDVQSAQWHYPSPQTVVGAVRKDPFDCYPLPVTQEDHELVDHLIRVMPTNFHSLAPRPDHHFQYFRDMIFRPAIDGPLSFQVMVLAFAAGNIEWTRRRPGDSALALKHKVRVGHIMNGRLKSNPNDCSDEMIMAVLGLAACEDINPTPHSKEKSWVHFRTAMQLVRNRGGPAAFAHNRRLTLHIN